MRSTFSLKSCGLKLYIFSCYVAIRYCFVLFGRWSVLVYEDRALNKKQSSENVSYMSSIFSYILMSACDTETSAWYSSEF